MEKINKNKEQITEISPHDSFLFSTTKVTGIEQQSHFHSEFELVLIKNGRDMVRTIGDQMEEAKNLELVFVGSNLIHGWRSKGNSNSQTEKISIQFSKKIFGDFILSTETFRPIQEMLCNSKKGIIFSDKTAQIMQDRIMQLADCTGMNSFLIFLSILHDLAISKGQKHVLKKSYVVDESLRDDKMEKVQQYIDNNFRERILLTQIANHVHMTVTSFNRFIKKKTGRTFMVFLNDVRIAHAAKLLLESDYHVSEIAYLCGFHNISNFNRIFKKSKKCVPRDYRLKFYKETINQVEQGKFYSFPVRTLSKKMGNRMEV